MGETKREVIGAVVRGFVTALDRKGLRNQVEPSLSPAAKELLKNPPLHITWVPARDYEELVAAAGKVAGLPVVRELGHDLAFNTVGPILRPLLKTVMNLFGGGPTAAFRNLNRAIPMQYKGSTFDFEPEGDHGGVLWIRQEEPVDPAVYAAWEGALEFGNEVTGVKLTVEKAQIAPDRKSARIPVKW